MSDKCSVEGCSNAATMDLVRVGEAVLHRPCASHLHELAGQASADGVSLVLSAGTWPSQDHDAHSAHSISENNED
jgi:hypothetical protein